MTIYLPIISNIVLAMILVAGLFIGKRNGFKTQLFKFLTLAVAGVGANFLAPITANLVYNIDIIATMLSIETVIATMFSVLTIFAYFIIETIFAIIKAIIRKRKNKQGVVIKAVKVKGVDKKSTAELRKHEKEEKRRIKREIKVQEKLARKQRRKAVKVFGTIFGVLTAIIAAFIVFLPIKYAVKDVVKVEPELEEITAVYEYTPFGQLDRVIDLGQYIVKGE